MVLCSWGCNLGCVPLGYYHGWGGYNAMEIDNKKAVKDKAIFYWQEQLICHLKLSPSGFINGTFKSELQNDTFYWFEDLRLPGKQKRLFLQEIFDIGDYEEVIE